LLSSQVGLNAVCETQQLYQFNDDGLRQKTPDLTCGAGATSPAWVRGRLLARTIFLEGFEVPPKLISGIIAFLCSKKHFIYVTFWIGLKFRELL